MNRKIAFLVIFIFLIFLCSSCFAYTEQTSVTILNNDKTLSFTDLEDFYNYVINFGDTNYYTINEIKNSNWFLFKHATTNAYVLYFDIEDISWSINKYVIKNGNNNNCPYVGYNSSQGLLYQSFSSSSIKSSDFANNEYLSNFDFTYNGQVIFAKNYNESIPEEPEEPEEPQEDYTTLIQYNNQLLEINNTMLIIIIFLILIYWLGKMFYMFFKATIL